MAREQERAELHKTIWRIANELRGSVDGWDFKQYILGLLFYRFISENLTAYLNQKQRLVEPNFDYVKLTDGDAEPAREFSVISKGFFILPSQLFENVHRNAKSDVRLNETLSAVFRDIEASANGADSEKDFKGLFQDIDVNSNKLGPTVIERNKKLVNMLDAIASMQLGNFYDNQIDAFGDAYEFLMTMYASNAGKSGGEFFTPQEVSELLAKITTVGKTEVNKVYDPACGSGSLLLKFAKVLGKDKVRQGFYGQEINITTYNLCRINMFLHDINYDKFDIALGDTLTNPKHKDYEPFDAIVSNPPYSISWAGDSDGTLINDPRFAPAGVLAPKSKADLAFTMHMLSWLSTSGTAAIVEFPGVLYRGGAEQKIRKYLVENNYVDCVIQLPQNLFFGVSIATCIIVLKKSKTDSKTLFIDASNEFVHAGNKNKLSDKNIERILDAYKNRQNVERFAELIDISAIADKDYNLSVSTYLSGPNANEQIDIAALNSEICAIMARLSDLRQKIDLLIGNIDCQKTTKIDELIKKYGSTNITYSPLGQICDSLPKGTLKQTELDPDGEFPVINSGRSFYGRYSCFNNQGGAFTVAARGEYAGYINYFDERFWAGGLCYPYRSMNEQIVSTKYIYYFLKSQEAKIMDTLVSRGGIPALNKCDLDKVLIPVPDISIQKKIVQILDAFSELSTELKKELDARSKQYEYYRGKLLTFSDGGM